MNGVPVFRISAGPVVLDAATSGLVLIGGAHVRVKETAVDTCLD
jgi:hypothetical protein